VAVMPDLVDLRSDTVTAPSPAMRRAMADAEVGDDGFGEDPTISRLEAEMASRLGKEAAVFVPTGTMANQIALRILGTPGSRVVAGRFQHVVAYERGAAAVNARVQFDLLDDAAGVLAPDAVRAAVEANGPEVSAVFIENTHMEACGAPWDLASLDAVVAIGRRIYMDGARLFNASVATGIDVAAYAARADVLMTCLSKGLGAPVGSVIAGSADDMATARIERKRLGGSMRQAGVLAAPALVALDSNVERLAEDHARARRLAEAVADRWPGALDPRRVRTNIVVVPLNDAQKVVDHLAADGVLAVTLGPAQLRLVTHLDVDDAGIDRACRSIATAP
jgi:threonine aldolase